MILEGIVTTIGPDGTLNVAPMGPEVEPGVVGRFRLRPFASSTTFRNLAASREGVLHITDDVLLIARAAIGPVDDATTRPAGVVDGRILTSACRYMEFRVVEIDDREQRATLEAEVVASGRLRDFFGLNRAKHAVIEAAILATRANFLPLDEIWGDFQRLRAPVQKTGGPDEHRAFDLLCAHVERTARARGVILAGCDGVPEAVRVRAASRLHFGPLAWGPDAPRSFGGVGLMIERPGLELRAERSDQWSVAGDPGSGRRVSEFAARVVDRLAASTGRGRLPAAAIRVEHAPTEHVGLGSGTQLGMAVARALTLLAGEGEVPVERLAQLAGRGGRSAIGLHGFDRGGLIVDGGHPAAGEPAPLVAHRSIPESWHALIVLPEPTRGLHGDAERDAFRELPPMPDVLTDRLCRLVLLGVLPSAAEADLGSFGAAISEIQAHVGRWFAPAQGGRAFASEQGAAVATFLLGRGLRGVGQSSWGPTIFGFDDGPDEHRARVRDAVLERFALPPSAAFWTRAAIGARWSSEPIDRDHAQ